MTPSIGACRNRSTSANADACEEIPFARSIAAFSSVTLGVQGIISVLPSTQIDSLMMWQPIPSSAVTALEMRVASRSSRSWFPARITISKPSSIRALCRSSPGFSTDGARLPRT
ncbi:hypothetical protein D9M69_653400 [compost metagenome]